MKPARQRANGDYVIYVEKGVGSMYIAPQANGLTITAHPNVEDEVIRLFGEPTKRYCPDSQDYASWFIPSVRN